MGEPPLRTRSPSTKRMQDTFKKTPHLSACLSLWQRVIVLPRRLPAAKSDNGRGKSQPWDALVAAYDPLRSENTRAQICDTSHQTSHSHWNMHNSSFFFFTHCDLWNVLFSLVRHVVFFPLRVTFCQNPLCTDAVAALAWMGASGNGRPSVSTM